VIEVLENDQNGPKVGEVDGFSNVGLDKDWQEVAIEIEPSSSAGRSFSLKAYEQYEIAFIDKLILRQ
jgi:hypothetical protein